MSLLITLFAQITVLITVVIGIASILRRRAILRYELLFTALLILIPLVLISTSVQQQGGSWLQWNLQIPYTNSGEHATLSSPIQQQLADSLFTQPTRPTRSVPSF